MPTPIATTSRTTVSLNKGAKSLTNLTNPQPQSRRTRPVRRRGRRAGLVDSDDEIERETLSDEFDSDEGSLLDDSASDTEPESDVESDPHRRADPHLDTPNTTQSSPPGDVGLLTKLNGFHDPVKDKSVEVGHKDATTTAFLSSGVDWSEMNGDELPVVEFSNLQVEGLASLPEPTQEEVLSAGPPMNEEDGQGQGQEEQPEETALLSAAARRGAHSPNRPRGRAAAQMARQAYQNRLQSDPSFVPVVGEFWGHDDRLMQKDLRSLSGWWRGRWQGRGRGRGGFVVGRGMGLRGRGRGGFVGGGQFHDSAPDASSEQAPFEEIDPPVDRTWTHDGFEEMSAREERRRAFEQERAARLQGKQGVNRGGFASGRGRGGFSRRGAFSPAPSHGSVSSAFANPPVHGSSDRIWYAKKPECPWTKQHEGFLHFDSSHKSRNGKGPTYRVKLPGGKGGQVVRAPVINVTVAPASSQTHAPESVTDRASNIVVRLPKRQEWVKEKIVQSEAEVVRESFTTVEELVAEFPAVTATTSDGTVAIPSGPAALDNQSVAGPSRLPTEAPVIPPVYPSSPAELSASIPAAQASVPEVFIAPSQISPSSMQNFESERARINQLPPIQTHFPPPPQPSPTFNSPYAFSAPQLPPGVALDQRGYAYEMASGRPVYLQPAPSPMPMYNPRPMPPPGMPFHPGHMSTMSSDYMMAPHTPPINGFVDPATGAPLFSFPRQSSRVEIRAPTDQAEGKSKEKRPSGLSRTMTAEDAAAQAMQVQDERLAPSMNGFPGDYFPDASNPYAATESAAMPNGVVEPQMPSQQVMDPSMVGFNPYNPYYYPEQYGYPAYAEFPQPSGQYEPYILDPHHPPAPIYY